MTRQLPSSLKTTRVLLFIATAIYAVGAAAGLYLGGANGVAAALVLIVTWPGIAYLVLGLLIGKGWRAVFWAIVACQALLLLMALGNFLSGEIGGLFQMIFPALILAFALLRESRDYFAGRTPAYR